MKKVLIVDDETKIIEVIKALLESKGYLVLAAETGRQALEIFDQENIVLIILDLMLPDLSGEEICVQIRKKSRVPIIMLTAKVEEADMLKGLNIGADDYITKPFSLKTLYARIEAVLRRSSDDIRPLFNTISYNDGDLEIDFDSHQVRKNHIMVSLTPNEFKLLSIFMKYPNRVFERDQLIQLVLGDEFEGYDRAIDSHIKNLRQKIESDPKHPVYILTVFGLGYRFGGDVHEQ